ncbi:beta-1,4-glucuronyltransferase 1 [Tribolium castaneum]|uniref:beta-1,4-glucuronyltransferase 1 n=1 Tax=Tribolium castaneum TaxID=7070 RepID=UPI0030FECC42
MFVSHKLFPIFIVSFTLLLIFLIVTSGDDHVENFSEILDKVKKITQCFDKPIETQIVQNGQFWVLNNYIKASERFKCHESVTITTQGDFTFLENLPILVERWKGPISVALYAPGTDFKHTIDSIRYLRRCNSPLIAKFVTFHIFFDLEHVPKKIFQLEEGFDCDRKNPPYPTKTTYKTSQNLLYPINVARNIARKMSQTHFILPLDIELFPNPDFIPKFLSMIARNQPPLDRPNPRVFPLPVFEIESGQKLPDNKTQLRELLSKNLAIPFHEKICPTCHNIPEFASWMKTRETPNLSVFHVGKRNGRFFHWEPIFVGTNTDPWYDERLSWEGKKDKMTQGYVLCVQDYDFMILDNAFLVHKPGIKTRNRDSERRKKIVKKSKEIIEGRILPQLGYLFGTRDGCNI